MSGGRRSPDGKSREGHEQRPVHRLMPPCLARCPCTRRSAAMATALYVMQQLGHTDPKMTLGLYAKALKSKRRRSHAQGVRAAGRALDPAANGHGMGTSGVELAAEPADTQAA